MKVQYGINSGYTDEQLKFIKQMGIDYVYVLYKDDELDYDSVVKFKERVEKMGLTITDAGNIKNYKNPSIHLGLDDRDYYIENYIEFMKVLGRAGIPVGYMTWEPNNVLTTKTDIGEYTRLAPARIVDIHELEKRPFTHGREFNEEEIWDNFKYFLDCILPICKESNVKIALHPNDPPVPSLVGIHNLIHNSDCYRKAFELAGDSPYLGMKLCVGCWLEGGDKFGNLMNDIKEFVGRKKVIAVHFRNVSSTIPYFEETLLEDGYMNMYEVMKQFVACDYDGTIHVDHVPDFEESCGGKYSAFAYSFGYMKALINSAKTELSK
ncbi:mannonate dehydratase [Mobilisporobacter senegalensis]|uniref:mannonate dehydratase n=1 Tax=Mobilisporobacter senegalensis TaxID=1329262 RepID=A0A3N1X9N8_9FIRM|nr:mannonate dehydratase [Mobilisporobacter senegalensis]ROR23435.1 mannonate dehydratase [Mobilisporobacter senegalensis]